MNISKVNINNSRDNIIVDQESLPNSDDNSNHSRNNSTISNNDNNFATTSNIGNDEPSTTDVSDNELSPKWKLYNILLLGGVFMLIFTAYQTCAMVQVLVLEGANLENNNTAGNGYTSLSIVYTSFAISNWLSAYIVEMLTSKWAMLIGASTYCLFLALFLKPNHILLYFSSALLGFGAAVLWASQGKFLSINSSETTMNRNTNIFWGLFQSSLIWGNLIIILEFSSLSVILTQTRTSIFIILTAVSCVGIFGILFLRNRKLPVQAPVQASEVDLNADDVLKPLQSFKKSLRIMFSKEMLLLYLIIFYTGIELSYWSALVTSVGHMAFFKKDSKELAGMCGLFIGLGQISSSLLFALFTGLRRLDKRIPLLVGFLTHVICFFIVFMTFPSESPIRETSSLAFFEPSKALVFLSSFLLGFGDSCINTQIYPTLRELYFSDMATACSIFKFLQSLASAVCFAYSRYVLMQVQLLILAVLLFTGIISFFILEARRLNRSGYYDF